MGPVLRGAIIGGIGGAVTQGVVGLLTGGIFLLIPLFLGAWFLTWVHEKATGAQEQQRPVFERKVSYAKQARVAFEEQKAMISTGPVEPVWPQYTKGFLEGLNVEIRNDSELTVRGGTLYCKYDYVEVWKKKYSTVEERFVTQRVNDEVEPGTRRVVHFPTPSDRRPDKGETLAGPIDCYLYPRLDYDEFASNYRG